MTADVSGLTDDAFLSPSLFHFLDIMRRVIALLRNNSITSYYAENSCDRVSYILIVFPACNDCPLVQKHYFYLIRLFIGAAGPSFSWKFLLVY
jgi:hypothetical protein